MLLNDKFNIYHKKSQDNLLIITYCSIFWEFYTILSIFHKYTHHQTALGGKPNLFLNEREKPVVFLLWGRNARNKKALITNPNHLVLEAAHPSPLSAYNGFFGCRHFSKANDFLQSHGMMPVDWQIQ